MTARTRFALTVGTALVGWPLGTPAPVTGCAVARRADQSVEIATETAVIVWDATTRTEHFIRRASFLTQSTDFGFLVPTPSRPDLGEAADAAFAALGELTAPATETHWVAPMEFGCAARRAPNSPTGPPEVRVLEEKRVAGYDAAVLAATDPDALTRWLRDHDYTYDPALADWVAHYVRAGYIITAFKIARTAADDPGASTAAVRMSFRADTPFYPYKEPAAPVPAGRADRRLLRLYFLADGKVRGTVGRVGPIWPGRVVHAASIRDEDRAPIWRDLGIAEAPAGDWWLSEFEDTSSPRPATDDVYFTPTTDRVPVRRPPHVRYLYEPGAEVCCCPPSLVAIVAVTLVLRWHRRRATRRAYLD